MSGLTARAPAGASIRRTKTRRNGPIIGTSCTLRRKRNLPAEYRSVVKPLVLASQSPRRAEILTSLGIPFRVRPVDIPEEPQPGETAEATAARLASEKAAAAARRDPEDWVLAADTLVFLDGAILGKPRDDE